MPSFADLVAEFFRGYWKLHPVEASAAGVADHDTELGDHSRRGFAERESFAKSWERRLAALRADDLGPEERIDREVILARLRGEIALGPQQLWARHAPLYAFAVLDGVTALLRREDASLEERMAKIAARLAHARAAVEAAIANLDADRAAPVHVVVAGEIASAGARYLRAYLPSVAPEGPAKRDLLVAGQEAAVALERYALWLRDDLMKRARGSVALGRDALEAIVRREHLLAHDVPALLRLAKDVFEETRPRLAEAAPALGARSWEQAVEASKDDHPAADELVDAYRAAVDAARDAVVPTTRDPLAVVEAPEHVRTIEPYLRYVGAQPFAPSRAARLEVTLPDLSWPEKDVEQRLRAHPRAALPLAAARLAYPGAHVFGAAAAAHPSPVRRAFSSALATAGWSLYAADLVAEDGASDGPRARLLHLHDRLFRAARVIADVGLATGEMNFEQAVKLLVEGARVEPPNAVAEARRYTLAPGRAFLDLVGRAEILRLREEAAQRGLARREFHERLLAAGALAPALAAREL